LKNTGKLQRFVLIPGNIFTIILLWISGLSAYIDPVNHVIPAFLGLAYPFILLLNFIFLFIWLLTKKKFMLISIFGLLLGWGTFSDFFQINFPKKSTSDTFKVMSYNVRLFDLYNWSHNKTTRNKIFNQLKAEDADIYCFQEFYQVDRKGVFETRDTLLTFLRAKNVREAYTHKIRGSQYFGVATFTSFPVINSGIIHFNNDINNVCLFTDLKIGSDTLRVYNLHIASIRFSYDDYDFIKNAEYQDDTDKLKQGARQIYHRLAKAFVKRSEQSKIVLKHIALCPYPVLVCGDFNDSPISWCYTQFSENLYDSFKEAGNGIGNTYIGAFPSYRIDYMFHSEQLEISKYSTLPEEFSDHHAITVNMNFKSSQ